MTQKTNSAQTQKRLIEAAIAAIQTHGIHGLTLEAVAQQAGVSKGGLLHHFPTKDALTEMILRHLFADFEAQVQRCYDREPTGPGRWLRAYARATFEEEQQPQEMIILLISAVLDSPKLLSLIQEDYARWEERLLNDGVPRARATIVRQATDAYWTEQLLGVSSENKTIRQELLEELLQLTDVTTP